MENRKSLIPTWVLIPDRPVRSKSLYLLHFPGTHRFSYFKQKLLLSPVLLQFPLPNAESPVFFLLTPIYFLFLAFRIWSLHFSPFRPHFLTQLFPFAWFPFLIRSAFQTKCFLGNCPHMLRVTHIPILLRISHLFFNVPFTLHRSLNGHVLYPQCKKCFNSHLIPLYPSICSYDKQ